MLMLAKLLLILASVFLLGEGVFITTPKSVIVFLNFTAKFHCQHSEDDVAIEWRINGTPVSVNHPPEVTIQGGNPRVLSLIATSEYNGTVFDCVADSLNSNISETSKNATVWIQGYLSAVGDLNITIMPGNTLITWTAPFTLNVTDYEPDITYRINTVRSDMPTTIIQNHTLTNYTIISDESALCGRFNIQVAPQNGAGFGPTTEMTGYVFTTDDTCSQTVIVKDMASIVAAGLLIPLLAVVCIILIIVVIIVICRRYNKKL